MAKTRAKHAQPQVPLDIRVAGALAWLQRHSSAKTLQGMARYGIPSDKAYGVPINAIQKLARELGRDQALAEALWKTDVYEARLLASFVGESEKLTVAIMNNWCADFDNWGIVDTVCFKLFDQSPLAWDRVLPWTKNKNEFQRRAGYVLIACLAAHNAAANDQTLRPFLPLIEKGATDERNFVKKGVSWALRMIGRRSRILHEESVALAKRLIDCGDTTARWVGKDALRDLQKSAVKRKVASR